YYPTDFSREGRIPMRRRIITSAALALCTAGLQAPLCRAMSLQPLNVTDLVRQSTTIVRGTVTEVREGVGSNRLPYTAVEVKVAESVKGSAGGTLTFRQFGLQSPRPTENGHRYVGLIAGMPRYAAGDDVLLFLGPESSLGYRTTIGLGQGHFALRGGNFENDANNAGLFRNVSYGNHTLSDREKPMPAVQQGAVAAGTFVALVRRAVNGNWWATPAPRTPHPRAPLPPSASPATIATEGGTLR